ncbi:C6 finger domain-containing protein [Stagonosporopsis vannaccii]|nr:C6 finger domain-containing protein [Stagonosporopsis vannaccii]
MVYRGRPSTGCKNCRERKIKCDETPEGCLKCAKVKLKCPGYDRNLDSFFHDETARTEVRAKKAKAKAIALRDARQDDSRASSVSSEELTPSPFVAQHSPGILLLAPLLDQGIAYFMSHYAVGLDQPSIRSEAYNKHLATNGFHPLVATSMTALGLAGVANIYRDTVLKSKATKWYVDAINMTNNAITHPKDVTSDTTLLAITLLGLFEATSNEHSLQAWGEHVAGAASLVKIRGMNQFASPAGRRMYLHAVGLLTMNCFADGVALPAYVQEMNEEIKKYHDETDPRNRFFFLQQDVVNLRADIMGSAAMSLETILDRALELDAAAENVFEHAGLEWSYEEVAMTAPSPFVFGDTYHIYPSHATAQTWNWVRYTKIYIHDIIRNTILAGLATSPPVFTGHQHLQQLANSIGKLQSIQSDILASAPQFLHDVPKFAPPPDTYPTPQASPSSTVYQDSSFSSPASVAGPRHDTDVHQRSSSEPFSRPHKLFFENFRNERMPADPALVSNDQITDRLPVVRISGGHSTLWALYTAGSMPTAERATQEFVIKCLGRFEREFGINQAKVLAAALRLKMARPEVEGICPSYLPRQGAPYVVPGERKQAVVEEM